MLLFPWNFPGKHIGVGYHFLLQGILLTQGSNLCLLCPLHRRQILYSLSYWRSTSLTISTFNKGKKKNLGSLKLCPVRGAVAEHLCSCLAGLPSGVQGHSPYGRLLLHGKVRPSVQRHRSHCSRDHRRPGRVLSLSVVASSMAAQFLMALALWHFPLENSLVSHTD